MAKSRSQLLRSESKKAPPFDFVAVHRELNSRRVRQAFVQISEHSNSGCAYRLAANPHRTVLLAVGAHVAEVLLERFFVAIHIDKAPSKVAW